jgi:hypothetical protein
MGISQHEMNKLTKEYKKKAQLKNPLRFFTIPPTGLHFLINII